MTHFNPKQICKMAKKYDRLEGIICGMIVGDALGVTNEFNPIQHPKDIQKRMAEEKSSHQTYPMQGGGNFRLPVGNWSDDASMGLCLIEGLLAMEESHFTPSWIFFMTGGAPDITTVDYALQSV